MTTTLHRLPHAALGMPVACASAVMWGGAASRSGITAKIAANTGRIGLKPMAGAANVPFAITP